LEKAKLTCLLGGVLLLAGCASTGTRPQAQVPAAAPALDSLPLKAHDNPLRPQPAPAAPAQDAADVLLGQVEARYQAGLQDYRQGNLEKAREDFDQAVDLLLESDLDVQGDDRLNGEFDKLVEDISAAEAAAQERGDLLSPRNFVPAPIESFSGLTFPVDPKVKQ